MTAQTRVRAVRVVKCFIWRESVCGIIGGLPQLCRIRHCVNSGAGFCEGGGYETAPTVDIDGCLRQKAPSTVPPTADHLLGSMHRRLRGVAWSCDSGRSCVTNLRVNHL